MRHHGHREEVRRLVRGLRGHQSEHFHRFRIKSSGRIHVISIRSVPSTTRSDPDALAAALEEAEHGLRWDCDDGVAAALSREDAIDATVVSLTRRDGRDAVRNGSKLTQKPPPTASVGGVKAPRDAAC